MNSTSRRAAFTFISTAALVAVVATMSVVGNKFPSNVFNPTGPEGPVKSVSKVFLQGWGFFTRDAREDRVSIAIKRPGNSEWSILDQDAIVQPKYAFGLSRISRAESIDINILYSAIDEDEEWVECLPEQSMSSCLGTLEPVAHAAVSPVTREPVCSSRLALVRHTPIPYGYRELTRAKRTQAVSLTVRCDDQ
ncbi:SdpA family antimicrobial peptide system protein [Microbacterium sp. X-17]|uniref:SdpA family antimicrobial peptide system protein n=1 Tax=Microbacterium sp. X-17 TaxID=3144404 RepID=UPI0031F4F9C5